MSEKWENNQKLEVAICRTLDGSQLKTKKDYLEFLERCWNLTQEFGNVREEFLAVIREDKAIVALCGNGPEGKNYAYYIVEAVNSHARLKADREALLGACKKALTRLDGSTGAEKYLKQALKESAKII